MALTATQVTQITDSLAQSLAHFNQVIVVNTATSTPSTSTILAGLGGTGANNTLGRIQELNDTIPIINLLPAINTLVQNMTAFLGGIQTLSSVYPIYYPFFDYLDRTCVYNGTTGLNAFLTATVTQVSGWFAAAFNYWCRLAPLVTPGRSSANAPVKISSANSFPTTAVDSLFTFTTGAGATMTSSGVGATLSTALYGGGVGQLTIYKANAGNAVGGATFTITYVNGTGVTTTATYSTIAGTPAGSGSLAAGYAVLTANASSVVSVTGTGMTSGESYLLGVVPLRGLSGY